MKVSILLNDEIHTQLRAIILPNPPLNLAVPILPSFYPILPSSISIPNGSALLISEQIQEVLRYRSIAAVYDSRGAKADCSTKTNVKFRIRLYRGRGPIDTIIVEIQRQEGFDLTFQNDVFAILDAAEGNAVDPVLDAAFDESSAYYREGVVDNDEEYTQHSLPIISDILCPDDGRIVMEENKEMALSALLSLTNSKRVGRTAILISRDVLYDDKFASLRGVIFAYACMPNGDISEHTYFTRVKYQSLEILANMTSCMRDDSDSQVFLLEQLMLIHFITLVEKALEDPRAADLACQILKNTSENSTLTDDLNDRLNNALREANRYGNASYTDLEIHSQECLALMFGVVA